jgi:hypothetical protein
MTRAATLFDATRGARIVTASRSAWTQVVQQGYEGYVAKDERPLKRPLRRSGG